MTLPRDLRRYLDVTLISGSPIPADLANGTVITAGVDLINYPDFGRAEIPIGRKYSTWIDEGRMETARLNITFRSAYASILASRGNVLGFTLTEDLFTPNKALAASGAAANPREWSVSCTARVLRRQRADFNANQDQILQIPCPMVVLTWQENYAGVSTPLCDYDWLNEIFAENGKNIFTGATV